MRLILQVSVSNGDPTSSWIEGGTLDCSHCLINYGTVQKKPTCCLFFICFILKPKMINLILILDTRVKNKQKPKNKRGGTNFLKLLYVDLSCLVFVFQHCIQQYLTLQTRQIYFIQTRGHVFTVSLSVIYWHKYTFSISFQNPVTVRSLHHGGSYLHWNCSLYHDRGILLKYLHTLWQNFIQKHSSLWDSYIHCIKIHHNPV